MRPNNSGGMCYEGGEIPVVIAAAYHQDQDFGQWLTDQAARQFEQQRIKAAGVNILDFNEYTAFKQSDDPAKSDVVPLLNLGQQETNRTYGNVSESYAADIFPRQQRRIARGILVEAGIMEPEPTPRKRMSAAIKNLLKRNRS